LEALEKKRFTDKINSERSALMSGAVSIKMDPSITAAVRNHSSDPYASDLPPIDDDPDVAEGLKMLQGQNQDIVRKNVCIVLVSLQ
jgi:hypothetical protein